VGAQLQRKQAYSPAAVANNAAQAVVGSRNCSTATSRQRANNQAEIRNEIAGMDMGGGGGASAPTSSAAPPVAPAASLERCTVAQGKANLRRCLMAPVVLREAAS
jgi:hypothetical protein